MLRTSASAAPGTCHRFLPGACPSGRVRGEQAPLDLFLGIFFFFEKQKGRFFSISKSRTHKEGSESLFHSMSAPGLIFADSFYTGQGK